LKLITDILKTILDGLFVLALVLAIAGFELSERPWQEPEETESICSFPCKFQDLVYRLVVKSAKYEYLKTNRRSE